MKKLLIIITMAILIPLGTMCQTETGGGSKLMNGTWSASLSFGSMLFYGDLREYPYYPVGQSPWPEGISERKYGFGLTINKKIHPLIIMQGQFQAGKLSGFKRYVNAYFTANIMAYGINGVVNLKDLIFPQYKDQKISVLGTVGIGLLNFETTQKSITSGEEISSYGTEKKMTEFDFPFGIGAKYTINPHFAVGVDVYMNNLNTDKLDARIKAGTKKDKYGYTCLSLTYILRESDNAGTPIKTKTPRHIDSVNTAQTNKVDSSEKKSTTNEVKNENLNKPDNTIKKSAPKGDDDGDGVINKFDKCPNTPSFAIVDANGCPFDEDMDGVPDYADKCSSTPNDVKVDSTGCPLDSDRDKVADYLDQCPDTPKKAKVDASGCPVDSDGDGIFDYLDKCPGTPKGTKVDAEGCPI